MLALLTEGRAGLEILERYNDRATFARSVINHLRKSLDSKSTASAIEFRIAREIPTIVRAAFPRGRGKLLFYLARILGDFDPIADAIRSIVTKSNSAEIMQVKPQILEGLSRTR
jgi:hypothetical protein